MALTEEGLALVPGMLSRWVRLASGAKAHYMTSGETGPAVILLHGGIIGSSGTAGWRFNAPFLGEHGFRCFCPDMPDFGLTEYPDGAYAGAGGYVDFIYDFMNALCIDQAFIAGNSMGCLNAVNFVVAHPERVAGFVLVAGAIGDLHSMIEAFKTEDGQIRPPVSLDWDGTRDGMKTLMEKIIYRQEEITDDLLDMRVQAAGRHQTRHPARLAALMGPTDPNDAARLTTKGRLDRLTLPGIYLYGRNDVLLPYERVGHQQEDVLPNIQFFYPDHTGHQGQTDNPDLFNRVFLEFFRDGKVSWETAQDAGISERRPPLPSVVAVPDNVAATV